MELASAEIILAYSLYINGEAVSVGSPDSRMILYRSGMIVGLGPAVNGKELRWIRVRWEDETEDWICDRCLVNGVSREVVDKFSFIGAGRMTLPEVGFRRGQDECKWDSLLASLGNSANLIHWPGVFTIGKEVWTEGGSKSFALRGNTSPDFWMESSPRYLSRDYGWRPVIQIVGGRSIQYQIVSHIPNAIAAPGITEPAQETGYPQNIQAPPVRQSPRYSEQPQERMEDQGKRYAPLPERPAPQPPIQQTRVVPERVPQNPAWNQPGQNDPRANAQENGQNLAKSEYRQEPPRKDIPVQREPVSKQSSIPSVREDIYKNTVRNIDNYMKTPQPAKTEIPKEPDPVQAKPQPEVKQPVTETIRRPKEYEPPVRAAEPEKVDKKVSELRTPEPAPSQKITEPKLEFQKPVEPKPVEPKPAPVKIEKAVVPEPAPVVKPEPQPAPEPEPETVKEPEVEMSREDSIFNDYMMGQTVDEMVVKYGMDRSKIEDTIKAIMEGQEFGDDSSIDSEAADQGTSSSGREDSDDMSALMGMMDELL